MRLLTTTTIFLIAAQASHAGILLGVKRALGAAKDESHLVVPETSRIRLGTSKVQPPSCSSPRFAQACFESPAIAPLDNGSIALQTKDPRKLKILSAEKLGPDIEIDVPYLGASKFEKGPSPRLEPIPGHNAFEYRIGYVAGEIKDGTIDLTKEFGDFARYKWTANGQLIEGTVSTSTKYGEKIFMTVKRTENGDYRIFAQETDLNSRAKPIEINSRFYSSAGETISSITNLDLGRMQARISGHRNGEPFSRVIGLELKPNTPSDITGFPQAGAI